MNHAFDKSRQITSRRESNCAPKFKIDLLFSYLQNLSSWKDRRRKQSEEALQRVAEVKGVKIESEDDDFNRQKKM